MTPPDPKEHDTALPDRRAVAILEALQVVEKSGTSDGDVIAATLVWQLLERGYSVLPSRAPESATDELGWLIEAQRNGAARYWDGRWASNASVWPTDSLKAVRFARKADAEAVCREQFKGTDFAVVEHLWASMGSAGPSRKEADPDASDRARLAPAGVAVAPLPITPALHPLDPVAKDVRHLAAMLLMELGRVPDPRMSGLRATTLEAAMSVPEGAFGNPKPRRLTDDEVEAALCAHFGRSPTND